MPNDSLNIPESPTIRPPSEWRSLLVRVTRGCKWNRCRFCGIYPHMGVANFSVRTIAEIKKDIDLYLEKRPEVTTAFLGDADPLQIGFEPFLEVLRYLRSRINLERITCYGRTSTLHRLSPEAIKALAAAGLDRVHIGLESGDDETLRYHRKGQSAKMIRETAARLKEAGIEISFYVLLGLGGRNRWQEHITNTARLVNETNPEFVRLRRIWIYKDDAPHTGPPCPLWKEIDNGAFLPQTPEGTVLELKLFLERLDNITSFITCDHANNYIRVAGQMMADRAAMLAGINNFLARPEDERKAHYQAVGSQI